MVFWATFLYFRSMMVILLVMLRGYASRVSAEAIVSWTLASICFLPVLSLHVWPLAVELGIE
jgi:hypothetical protein